MIKECNLQELETDWCCVETNWPVRNWPTTLSEYHSYVICHQGCYKFFSTLSGFSAESQSSKRLCNLLRNSFSFHLITRQKCCKLYIVIRQKLQQSLLWLTFKSQLIPKNLAVNKQFTRICRILTQRNAVLSF